MKILVLSPILPGRNQIRTEYVEAVFEYFNKITKSDLYWVIFQPNTVFESNNKNVHIVDLHNYANGFELIQNIKPDVFLSSPTLEPIHEAISIVAKEKKIPIISFDHAFSIPVSKKNNFYLKLKLFFSNKLPNDVKKDEQFLRRGKFIIFKLSFLIKTQFLSTSRISKMKFIFNDFVNYIFSNSVFVTPYADYYLLSADYNLKSPSYSNFKNEQLFIVGNPYWDKISNKIKRKKNTFSNKSKILVMTGSLHEHGYWNNEQRSKFLANLFKNLSSNPNISFDLKIHPSSENKEFYTSFLNNLQIISKVFQKENLWDIAIDYDILISYGYSQGITEAAYGGKKMIYIDTHLDIPYSPLLNEAFDEGHFIKCDNLNDLQNLILQLSEKNISLSEKFQRKCDFIFPKTTENSAELIAKTIFDFIRNFKT